MIYCTCVLFNHTENRTSPERHRSRIKDQRGLIWYEQEGPLKCGGGNQMATDALDPLRQVLDVRHAIQQFAPVSLASGFPCFCSCGFHAALASGLSGPLTHLSSFVPIHFFLHLTLRAPKFLRRWH